MDRNSLSSLRDIKKAIEHKNGKAVNIADFIEAVKYSNRKAAYSAKKDASYAKLMIEDVLVAEAIMSIVNTVTRMVMSDRKEAV